MKYPIIVDYDGEVLLLKDENDISRIEPVDVESGNCRFWDAKGCSLENERRQRLRFSCKKMP